MMALKRLLRIDFDSEGMGLWIETELQNRFQPKCGMEFGILGSDDGLPEFRI